MNSAKKKFLFYNKPLTKLVQQKEVDMKRIYGIIALVLLLSFLLPSCSSGIEPVPQDTKPEVTTTKKKTEKKTEEKTEEEKILQEYDPAEDDEINVLMIGNSFSYYYVEELYNIAKTVGIKMKVCNVYYSGCKLSQHWTWWKQNESHYQYFETNHQGRRKIADPTNLKYCLSRENWDVISFQQGTRSAKGDLEVAKNSYYKYLTDLYELVTTQFPKTRIFWHQTWSYQVGYDRNGVKMLDAQQQATEAKWQEEFSIMVCKDFNMTRVPSGSAWQYARQDSRIGDILCNRGARSDNYHEGEEGGGQYLNACVWFEVITGQSCIGNTWRPDTYSLSEPMIAGLQQAAHRAVSESRG